MIRHATFAFVLLLRLWPLRSITRSQTAWRAATPPAMAQPALCRVFKSARSRRCRKPEHADLAAGRAWVWRCGGDEWLPGTHACARAGGPLGLSEEQQRELQRQMRDNAGASDFGRLHSGRGRTPTRPSLRCRDCDRRDARRSGAAVERQDPLRVVHLRTHLATRATLTADQIAL